VSKSFGGDQGGAGGGTNRIYAPSYWRYDAFASWTISIRDDAKRTMLLEMDVAMQRLARKVEADDEGVLSLTGVYHNLLRQWAEV